jgi:hypothetical protein
MAIQTALDSISNSTSGSPFGFKNRIINGAMGIWQRGTSSSTLGAFVADRWGVTAGTSVTATRSTDVPSGFQYSLSLAGTNFPQTYQRIESLNCVDLPGQTITISFWAKQTSGAGANSLAVGLSTPTAVDNYSAINTIEVTTFTGSTSWTQYAATFTNVSATIANGLQVLLYANTAGSATFLITGVQLEKGSTATSFDYRPYGTELALCQRYYETAGASLYVNFAISSVSNILYGNWRVTKRAAPTITFLTGSPATFNAIYATTTDYWSVGYNGTTVPANNWNVTLAGSIEL